jgi:hypothetical protein
MLPATATYPLEFELAEDPKPSLLSKRKAARRAAPFASVTMTHSAASSDSNKVPAFTIASAVESKPVSLEGVPQWRIAAGNLAAGATAGCAVEAGGEGRRAVHSPTAPAHTSQSSVFNTNILELALRSAVPH